MNSIKGFLGINLFVGYLVAYPTRRGSSLFMNIGQIVEIGEKEHPWRGPDDSRGGSKIPYAKVRVLKNYPDWDPVTKTWPAQLGRTTSDIDVTRMVPIAWDDIPLDIARLFDPEYGLRLGH